MVSLPFALALLAQFMSFAALEFYYSLGPDNELVGATTTSAEAVRALLPVATMGALLAAVTCIYRHQMHHAAAADAGAGTEVTVGIICAAVGVIEVCSFVLPAAQVDDGARARELGLAAAARVLPSAATTTFFLGLALVFLHVRAGGGAVAREGPIQILIKIVLGATAVLVGLMALAL
jgi:hypothetical protein